MQRNLKSLAERRFDLVVIGGGMFGAAAALDAAQRGLEVALLERGDFGGATSAHSYKMIHGGIRYLQHADIYRVRQSSSARSGFLRVAPHLCKPLPIVIPTYGSMSMKSKPVLWAGIRAYDVLTADRNRGIKDRTRHIPNGWFLPRDEILSRYPGLSADGLTGAGIFCDGQMYNPPRIVLAHVQSAAALGAEVANYAEVTGFVRSGDRVQAVNVTDRCTGARFEVQAKLVLNAAGPYAGPMLARSLGTKLQPPQPFSRDAYFIVPRRLFEGDHALSLPSRTSDPDARFSRGGRHLFLVPWRDVTLVGVWHKVYDGDPDKYEITDAELQSWIDEVNEAYPQAGLRLDEVCLGSAGLVPFGENAGDAEDLKFAHRSRIIDHARVDGLEGLVTLIGVRYTTGPYEAARLVSDLLAKLDKQAAPSRLAWTAVHGGDVDDFERLVGEIEQAGLEPSAARALAHNQGSAWKGAFERGRKRLSGSSVIEGEIEHAIESEMAVTLADLVFRRTDLATTGIVDQTALKRVAEIAAKQAGWTPDRQASEMAFIEQRLSIARTGRTMLADELPSIQPVAA